MISMTGYDVMEDNIKDFAEKQGYTVAFDDALTKALRYAKVLQIWGFIDEEETQRIFNRILIRIIAYSDKI